MPTLTDIIDEVKTLHSAISDRVDTLDKEQKKLGEELTSKTAKMPAEYKQSFDDMNTRVNSLLDLVNELRISQARPGLASGQKEMSPARKAFLKAMKKKGDLSLLTAEEKALIVPDLMPAEQKALYAGDATTGGFFAATDFMAELQEYKILISPMRQICRVQKTSGERVQMPALANDTTVYWATEQSAFTDSSDPTTSMINIPVHEQRGLIKISEQNLEDSMFDLESLLKERLGLKFAQSEGTAFVSGSGVGRPRGFLSYPIKASSGYSGGSAGKNNVIDAIPYVPTGVSGNITADSILNVFMDLKSVYATNATYGFTRGTLNTIRLFKDSMNRPLWQPFAASNLPSTVYDRPYVELPDMSEISANAYAVVVGDFKNYMIVDRVTMNIRQLNELYAASGLVGFIARMRVGGDLLLPESFRLLKCSAS